VRVYLTAARLSLRRYLTYRSSAVAGVLTNTAFGFIRVFVLIALWKQKPEIGGYDMADAVTYAFLTQGLISPMGLFLSNTELGPRIRSGDVAIDLYRPVDFQAWWLAADLGRAGASFLLRALPPVAIGLLFFPMSLPADPLRWVAFALCCALGLLVSFAVRYIMSVAAFWTMDERGMASLLMVVSLFFSGMIIPLVIMPGWLGTLARALPWSMIIQVPVNVLLGTEPGGLGAALAFGGAWAAGLLGLGRLMTLAARRRVVVQGG
jgi:ABC-2 type transport system permease protein